MTAFPRTAITTAVLLASAVVGCSSDDPAVIGPGGSEETGRLTLVSDDSRATVPPVCVGDIPADITSCAGAPAHLGRVELDATRKATLQVPSDVASGGYRVRVNGQPLPDGATVLEDQSQQLRIPVEAISSPGETVLTVEALPSPEHPRAVWQFLLSDPAGAPS